MTLALGFSFVSQKMFLDLQFYFTEIFGQLVFEW